MSFVYSLSKLFKIKDKKFISSMKTFNGLPHRFEIFLKKNGIIFVNDSKATTFQAAQSAVKSLKNIYWILGGIPKKRDKLNFTKFKKNIIRCYIIGKNIHFFKSQIKGRLDYLITQNLKNSIIRIFKDIEKSEKKEKTILLSPAAASFDQFNNFEKRGEEFKKLCISYARRFI